MFMLIGQNCRKDYYPLPPQPKTSTSTLTLEAVKVTTPPNTITAPYWNTADYLSVAAVSISKNQLYGDGYLNMTGTYSGLTSFNKGSDPELTLKAAYDNENIYILIQWWDSSADFSNGSWLYNGPADSKKSDTANGWTSQRNCDHVALAFEIASASSSNGSFSSVGCSASCHSGSGGNFMYPTNGKVDIWNWNTAHSSPLGYAEDMVATSTGLSDDAGKRLWSSNNSGSTSRSGPAYEWSGVTQNVTLANGSSAILDPAFYLMNRVPFKGNINIGDSIFHTIFPGNDHSCATCHGNKGEGGEYGAVNSVSLNGKSRLSLISSMLSQPEMAAYFPILDTNQQNDVIAYIRGLCGVPGSILSLPNGSNADITAVSNVTPIDVKNAYSTKTNRHTKYQVLLIRKLRTNNSDDVQFDSTPGNTYKFGIALMDNDGKNHIGALIETLTFK
jgi:mono/diheme cytochrome c family protein